MVQIVPQELPDLGFSSGCRIEEVDELPCMKIVDEVQLPMGLEQTWVNELHAELESATQALPKLSAAALELAELAVSGEYNAEIVGAVLDRDEKLRDQVVRMANSTVYAVETRVENTTAAAQRIGMRALWEIAVVDVAHLDIFGPVLRQVLGGGEMWKLARLAGAISHRLSAAKFGKKRASILAGLILCAGPPLAHQVIRRVEERARQPLAPRLRREVSNRLAPRLGVMLVRAWELDEAIALAAESFADGRGELPDDTEAQIAVFSVSLARYISARGSGSLKIPLRWPAARALGIEAAELSALVAQVSQPSESFLSL